MRLMFFIVNYLKSILPQKLKSGLITIPANLEHIWIRNDRSHPRKMHMNACNQFFVQNRTVWYMVGFDLHTGTFFIQGNNNWENGCSLVGVRTSLFILNYTRACEVIASICVNWQPQSSRNELYNDILVFQLFLHCTCQVCNTLFTGVLIDKCKLLQGQLAR